MKNLPLKRHKALQNLSREHHDSLVFVLRLQKGVAKQASLQEMDDYIQWYWEAHLQEHFEMEETHLFPKLASDNISTQKAQNDHKLITQLIHQQSKSYDSITQLYKTLKAHIRFEERELFMFIQEHLSKEELAEFERIHTKQIDCGLWVNGFWE
jgi:hemerythrin-like domain-containing protein